ncbi:hypothetical protein [Shewanella psychrotolerans]|uniref:hypothetical protein n=1 Tax=Shewanella psychrotolerans TaxID=2864206 RepID=UPI001C657CC5|nr:hypothetical protein [Shewanella psychrotolerans]QYJ99745.1 hypothetical protein K0I62_09685 [Shewanella psychrotolerans]
MSSVKIITSITLLIFCLFTANSIAKENPFKWAKPNVTANGVISGTLGVTKDGLDRLTEGGETDVIDYGYIDYMTMNFKDGPMSTFRVISLAETETCNLLEEVENNVLMYVEGTSVKSLRLCFEINEGTYWAYMPITAKGRAFVVDKLLTMHSVEINGLIFKTEGFKVVYDTADKFTNDARHAL